MDRSIKSRAVVIAENLLVAAAYAISGKIGLLFPYAGDHVTLFWPPLGIAIAALLLRGLHVSPGIVVGSLAVNVSTGAGPLLASGIAIGNTAAPVLAYFLLKKESISEYYLSSPSKIISFLGIAALMAPLVSATGGVLSLSLFGGLDRSPWLTWMVWWFGDATGVLCWTPFLILLHPTLFKRSYPASKVAAFLLLLTLQITTSVILFQQGSEHSILIQQLGPVAFLLLLLVTASILPPWFSSCSIVVFSLIASVFTSLGSGPFAGYAPHIGVAICWIYISTAGVLCLIISSLLDAKSEDQTRLSTLVKNLSSALETAHVNSQIGDLYHKTMNHELRTPLTGILGMSELLDDKNLSDQQRDELSAIRSSAENLKTILDDILEFSRIEMQHVTLQPEACDLKQLFTTTLRIFEALSRPKGVQLKIDLEDLECPYAKIDRARLRQVVSNLLNNAVKFTSEGHVELRASSRLVDHDPLSVRIHCSIADTGVGIAKDLQSKIFERFVSLKPTSNQKAENGIGLGLPICRDLITLMGGNLHLDSSPDNGTRVSFSFFAPLSDESAAEESSLATPYSSTGSSRPVWSQPTGGLKHWVPSMTRHP